MKVDNEICAKMSIDVSGVIMARWVIASPALLAQGTLPLRKVDGAASRSSQLRVQNKSTEHLLGFQLRATSCRRQPGSLLCCGALEAADGSGSPGFNATPPRVQRDTCRMLRRDAVASRRDRVLSVITMSDHHRATKVKAIFPKRLV